MVIICLLKNHPKSAYEINGALATDLGVRIGPSTIYSKLYKLEKTGQVSCIKGRSGNVYGLTEQGKQTLLDMPIIVKEIYDGTEEILGIKIPIEQKR